MHRNIDEPMEGTAPDNVVRRNHASLFHGRVEDVSFIKYPGTRSTAGRVIATVPLVKNTNNIRVALAFVGDRNTRGTGIDKERFSYAIYDTNGYMDFDNSLLPDDEVTYQPFHLEDGTLTTEAIDGEQQTFPTVTAEFSTARLLETQAAMLEIIDKETGRGVLPHCSLIKYLALLKSQNFIDMPLQEYLDREDHFSIVFFIDSNFTMLKTVIQINEWIVHLNEIEL